MQYRRRSPLGERFQSSSLFLKLLLPAADEKGPGLHGLALWPHLSRWLVINSRRPRQNLMKVPGLSKAMVAQFKAAMEIGKRLQAKPLSSLSIESSAAVAAHLRPRFLNARHEMVYVILLDGIERAISRMCFSYYRRGLHN